jgi:hypothetical protein
VSLNIVAILQSLGAYIGFLADVLLEKRMEWLSEAAVFRAMNAGTSVLSAQVHAT